MKTLTSKILIASMALCLFTLTSASPAFAAGKLYKWVDETGKVRYSDQVPPEHAKYGRQQINRKGFVTDEVERAKTPEELRKEQELADKKEREELISRTREESDRKLLRSYKKVDVIDREIKARNESINSAIKLTQTRIEKLTAQVAQLENQAADLERRSGDLPLELYKKIDDHVGEIAKQKKVIEKKRVEKVEVIAKLNADRKRYLELVGQKKTN